MAKNEKVISFRAEDKGVSSLVEKFRKEIDKISASLIRSATEINKISQSIAANNNQESATIREQIVNLEKRNRLLRENKPNNTAPPSKIEVISPHRGDYEERLGFDKQDNENNCCEALKETLTDVYEENRTQTGLLRELVSLYRNTAIEETERRTQDQDNQTTEEDNGKKGPGFWKMAGASFVGNVGANVLNKVLSLPQEMAGSETDLQVMSNLWSVIPLIGGALSTASLRTLGERTQVGRARGSLKATTGKDGLLNMHNFGMDYSETIPYMTDIARNRGFSGNLKGDTEDFITMNKAYNLDMGGLMSLMSMGGYNKGNFDSVSGLVGQTALNGLDPASLNNSLEALVAISKDQSQSLQNIDTNTNVQLVGAFQKIYGNDPRISQFISATNGALKSPQNQYQQALSFAVLSQMPQLKGKSYVDYMMAQEGGASTPGFLSGTIKMYEKMYGSMSRGAIVPALSQRFNMSMSQSDFLYSQFKKDRTVFDKIGSQTDIDKLLSTGKSQVNKKVAEGGIVPEIDIHAAKISDKFFEGMMKGMGEMGKLLGESIYEVLEDQDWGFMGNQVRKGAMGALKTLENTAAN